MNQYTKKEDGGGGNRTRVREHFNTGYYMLSISFGVSSIGLPHAGFTADYLKLNLAPCPLRTSKAHSPFVDVGLIRRDRKLARRAAFIKQLEPILHRQLNCFRLFNEACGDLGMQPLNHLLSSRPFHPRM